MSHPFPTRWTTACAMALFAHWGAEVTIAEDVSRTSGVSVSLELPSSDLVRSEMFQFKVKITNDSDEPLPLAGHPADIAGGQLFIDADCAVEGGGYVIPQIGDAEWPPTPHLEISEMGVIAPEESRTVVFNAADLGPFALPNKGARSVQAKMLIGDGQWVSSERIPVTFHDVEIEADEPLFQGTYRTVIGVDGRSFERPFAVYEAEVAGKRQLFTSSRNRFGEVPAGATPQFSLDPGAGVLRITFPGTEVDDIVCAIKKTNVSRVPSKAPGTSENLEIAAWNAQFAASRPVTEAERDAMQPDGEGEPPIQDLADTMFNNEEVTRIDLPARTSILGDQP